MSKKYDRTRVKIKIKDIPTPIECYIYAYHFEYNTVDIKDFNRVYFNPDGIQWVKYYETKVIYTNRRI